MSLQLNKSKLASASGTLFLPLFKDSLKKTNLFQKLLGFDLLKKLRLYKFEASTMEKLSLELADSENLSNVVLIGLGAKKDADQEKIFKAFSSITYSETQKKYKTKEITIVYPAGFNNNLLPASINGLNNGHYSYDKYKTKKSNISNLSINLVIDKVSTPTLNKNINKSAKIFDGVNLTRDLVNEQPLVLTPTVLANFAKGISKYSNIKCTVFGKKEILKRKMLGIWDVAKGSGQEPRFIHLQYKPKKLSKNAKKIAIIGKGVTYDSGGLSLKPADYMSTMKMDMAGAGCVLGVFESLGQIQPKNIEVHGLVPAVENMPGPDAYKPDDIVTGLSGKTIEVINTDAEGRVVLSDAIEYANQLKVDEMIDLATLTGACMVALGNYTAGLFSNNNRLATRLIAASRNVGEKLWQLPLDNELRQDVESQVADIRNSALTRYGGAITAAMFLEFFVNGIPWSHIDIAGPAYIEKRRSWIAPGSTGYGVRTLLNYLGI
ncbi:MAG: leucyl aminopeptidase [Thermodesulfobacteriota bacterium]|nr:leucyl aminopeptidase [Thermodesulfobacteriota bacterium]